MIGIFIVVFIAVVSIIRYFISDYDKCYSEREKQMDTRYSVVAKEWPVEQSRPIIFLKCALGVHI